METFGKPGLLVTFDRLQQGCEQTTAVALYLLVELPLGVRGRALRILQLPEAVVVSLNCRDETIYSCLTVSLPECLHRVP